MVPPFEVPRHTESPARFCPVEPTAVSGGGVRLERESGAHREAQRVWRWSAPRAYASVGGPMSGPSRGYGHMMGSMGTRASKRACSAMAVRTLWRCRRARVSVSGIVEWCWMAFGALTVWRRRTSVRCLRSCALQSRASGEPAQRCPGAVASERGGHLWRHAKVGNAGGIVACRGSCLASRLLQTPVSTSKDSRNVKLTDPSKVVLVDQG